MKALIPISVVIVVLVAFAVSGQGPLRHVPVSVLSDWTDRHVIFPSSADVPMMVALQIQRDPRYLNLWHYRHRPVPPPARGRDSDRDWSVSLGGAGAGPQNTFPAKFSFDVTMPADCVNDFVVMGINAAGATGQANIVGLNQLYSGTNGLCAGRTQPAFMFAYNVGPGSVYASVALSLDGKKLAFNENNGTSSYFHVLTWASGTGNGTDATHPVQPHVGNAAVDTKLALNEGSSTAPFVDYVNDVAYVTTTTHVHKFTHVFTGTPAEVITGGWPYAPANATGLSTPIFEEVTKHLFYKDFDGTVYYIDDSVVPAIRGTGTFPVAGGADPSSRPVVLDPVNGKIYAYTSGITGGNCAVGQADLNLSTASQVKANIGNTDPDGTNPYAPDFNNAYYSGTLSGAYLYIVGNNSTTNLRPALYRVGFGTGWKMNSTTASGPLNLATNTANVSSAPVTEFYNATLGRDFLFVGISNACSGTVPGGCVRSLNITSAFPTTRNVNSVILAATGGTSGITVDNYSSAGQASSIYYVTLGNGSAGTYALVKATQSALQ